MQITFVCDSKDSGQSSHFSQVVADYILSFFSANIELEPMTMKLTT